MCRILTAFMPQTVNAQTRGLWLYPSAAAVPAAGGGVMRVLFIDCEGLGAVRVISDCHFAVQLNHFISGFLSYSVAVFLK